MRWIAALGVGILAVATLFATFFAQQSLDDWRSGRASALAQIASIERDTGNPNREAGLKEARGLLDLNDGVAIEKIGLAVLGLLVSVPGLVASWRYAGRFFNRIRLVALAVLGGLIPVVVGGAVLFVLGVGAIRG